MTIRTTPSPHPAKPQLAQGASVPVQTGERAVVVGLGASGEAAARLLAAVGAKVCVLERSEANVSKDFAAYAASAGIAIQCGAHTPEQFAGAALVVTSPGVPVAFLQPLLEQACPASPAPLMGEMELALRYVQEPILAITGTSGKTTTVSLAAAMLEAAGKKVFLGGNIGTPLSSYVLGEEKADVLVLELSSFQLQGCSSLHPRVAVILNLTANHLDYHKDMAEYTDAKFRIFAQQTKEDSAIVPESLVGEYQNRQLIGKLLIPQEQQRFPHMLLAGKHNAFNAETAFQACAVFGVTEAQAAQVVASFAPLRHRLETAGTHDGVLYVNDSKCTTVDAMHAALTSFDAPVLLLAGGKFKGGDLEALRPVLQERVKAVALFGASREIFEKAWQGTVSVTWDAELPAAVARLRDQAVKGDVVLLSPATASYDLYKNYEQRGDHFCSLVQAMISGTATAETGGVACQQ